MTQEGVPMWDDPNESPAVRRLLRAGRSGQVDYDVEQGLARHLAQLQAGAPLPAWATQVTQVATTPGVVTKVAATSLLGWLVPPAVSLLALGGWMYFQQAEPRVPTLSKAPASDSQRQPEAGAMRADAPAAASGTVQGADAPTNADAVFAMNDVEAASNANALPSVDDTSKRTLRTSRAIALRHSRDGRVGSRFERGEYRQTSQSQSPAPSQSVVAPSATAAPSAAEKAAQNTPERQAASARQSVVELANAKPEVAAPAQAAPKPDAQLASAQKPSAAQRELNSEGDTRLEREMQMLAVAQRMLSEDPERALRLSHQGDQEFPRSMFSAERKQIALLAMIQLGRLDEARRLAKPFLRAYPNAPWTPRLREALATGQVGRAAVTR